MKVCFSTAFAISVQLIGHVFAAAEAVQAYSPWSHQNVRCLRVMAARDPSLVTDNLYSRLATSLRSQAILLPIYLYLLSLASTFATIFPSLPYVSL